jgi:hypothetical protein
MSLVVYIVKHIIFSMMLPGYLNCRNAYWRYKISGQCSRSDGKINSTSDTLHFSGARSWSVGSLYRTFFSISNRRVNYE